MIEDTFDEAEWAWLKPHAMRDALILVDKSLDLLEVGKAIAEDQKERVQDWVSKGWVIKPTQQQIEDWDQIPGKRFLSLVVQPFVLIQEQRLH